MTGFLATTALSEFWDMSGRIVFLEPRCLPADCFVEGVRDRQVLANPWADRTRFQAAATYLERTGERLLAVVADHLTAVHGRPRTHRYWRIVLGNWLINYLHATYDRYVRLSEAFAAEPELRTLVLSPECWRVPAHTHEMVLGLKDSDLWNLQLMSHVLLAMGYTFDCRHATAVSQPVRRRRVTLAADAGRRARGLAERLVRSLRPAGPSMVLYSMEVVDQAGVWRLAMASRFRILPMARPPEGPVVQPAFDDRRLKLANLESDDHFQRVALQCMPHYLPPPYLEGYEQTRRRALTGWQRFPRVIATATGCNYDEVFQFFAAEAVESGTRMVGVQHGAGYGYLREWPSERHERRLSDKFIAWGWADGDGGSELSNLPNPKLSRFCVSRSRLRDTSETLFVSAGYKRYQTRFNSSPQGVLNTEYFGGQLRFLAALTPAVRQTIRFRPRPGASHPLRHLIASRYSELRWDGGRTYYESLANAPVVVVDHPGSAMLEPLAADIPTVLFWDPHHWEMRPVAEPYFAQLRVVGILHDSPEAAADHICRGRAAIDDWWQDSAVQAARSAFVRRFALVDREWRAAWLACLKEEVSVAERSHANRADPVAIG